MKNLLLILFLIFSLNNQKAQSQDPWAEYMTPSNIHSMLEKYAGNFEMEISMDMGGDQSSVTVDSYHSMLLGGRFLEMKQNGTMMGMEYESLMTLGFNNSDKKVALTTITNMGTGTLSLFGVWDEKTKSADLFGQLTNPVTKEPLKVRQKISFFDGHTILIESFDQEGDSPEKKTVQYKLTRKE